MPAYFKRLKPTSFFIVCAVFFELLLNVVAPPLQAPDEFSHFYRAFQVSEGHFFPEKADQRLGGSMPTGLIDFVSQHKSSAYIMAYTLDHHEILNSCKIPSGEKSRLFQDFANTSYYSPVSYAPQAIALFVLRKFSDNLGLLYYGGRIFTFLCWLLCMFFVIRTVPLFKWLFTFLILLPMNTYIANSYSADVVTNMLAFVFITLVLKHTFITEKLRNRHLLALVALICLLALAKVVYCCIIVLLLLIPAYKFRNSAQRIFSLTAIFVITVLTASWWSGMIMQYYIPIKDYNPAFRDVASLSPCGDYYAQQSYILHHWLYFPKVVLNSLFSHPRTYLSGYIGVFGNGDIGLPAWIYVFTYIFIFVIAGTEKNSFFFSRIQKLILIAAALAALILLLLSQHLIWDCVGEGIVDLVQGRYLVPLCPLLFMILGNSGFNKFNANAMIILVVIALNVYSSLVIYTRFFVGPPAQKIEFSCDVEQIDNYGAFKTNNPEIYLDNPNSRVGAVHNSGKFSAALTPESPYCFTYRFKDIKPGDLVEAEAWEKGEGALIVVASGKKNCDQFYFGGTYNSYKNKQGWQRIKTVYEVKSLCDSVQMEIYVWNPGKTTVYIDDFKVSVKKFGREHR